MRCFLLVLLALAAVSAQAAPQHGASAEGESKRVALVIGNNAYKSVHTLARAVNDARSMAAALQKSGFATTLLTDANQKRMNKAVNEFADSIGGGGVGVLFFAGHGVQIDNQNFLLPVDIEEPQRDTDVQDQALSLQGIQEKLAQARAKFALMVIDACRDNPLPHKAGRSIGATRGLTQPTAPNGQMIIFSAGANETALDSLSAADKDPNGLFTREFLPVLNQPGLSISDALKAVRRNVIAKAGGVNHDQHPAIYDQSDGDFYFNPAPADAAADKGPKTSGPDSVAPASGGASFQAAGSAADEDDALWLKIKDSKRVKDYDLYLERFPKGRYVDAARLAMHGGAWVADARTGCRIWDPRSDPSDTVTWTGQCVDGRAEGSGTSEWTRGTLRFVIDENLKAGRFDGRHLEKVYRNDKLVLSMDGSATVSEEGKTVFKGKKVHESGDEKDYIASEEGKFVDGSMVDGTITYKKGLVAQCKLEEGGKFTGTCVIKGADGSVYDGDMKDGHKSGHAKTVGKDAENYDGAVEDGKANGYGKWSSPKGDTYEGDFKAGRRNGKGVYAWKNGCRYVGDFVDGKQHGQGVYTCPDGKRNEGAFVAGVFTGPSK